jgi:hypothetical protein
MLAERNAKYMGNLNQNVRSLETQTYKQNVNRSKTTNKTPDTFLNDKQSKGLPERQL